MEVHETIEGLRAVLDAERGAGRTVGFVPTMGYLHEGHVSLMRLAVERCDVVVASIFVNPLQFAAGEDLADYPRDLERDSSLTEDAGVDRLFVPSVDEMYPGGPVLTTVAVADLSHHMEGVARPTHFAGVATVVAKLFAIVGPCHAWFGEKDFQQLAVVRRMAADLSFPVVVEGGPIVREPDGLAMSSRNVYLRPDERQAATVLHRALLAGAAAIAAGERSADAVRSLVRDVVEAEPLVGPVDYAEVVAVDDLSPVDQLRSGQEVRLLVGARCGAPRLLDNVGAVVP